MPALQFLFHGSSLTIKAADPTWLAHYADYFRAYAPAPLVDDIPDALQLELFPAQAAARPAPAHLEKLAQTGVVSLWRALTAPETLWLYAGATTFEIHPRAGRAIGYLDESALAMPPILTNTYSLFALLLLLRQRGTYHLHAAATQLPDGRLCWIVGAQRSGKTTLVTALGLGGWKPLGDDSLLISWQNEQAMWQTLRKAFHLGHDILEKWQERWVGLTAQPRYLDRSAIAALDFFHTHELAAQTFHHVNVLLYPQVQANAKTTLEPLAASEALRQLAEQSMFFPLWSAHTAAQWRALLSLTQTATSWTVHASYDLLVRPDEAASLFGEVGRFTNPPYLSDSGRACGENL